MFFSIINKINSFKIKDSFPSMTRTIKNFNIDDIYEEALRFVYENSENLDTLTSYIALLEDNDISISYRIKSQNSYKNKWNNKMAQSMQLREVCNDLIGIRMIVDRSRNNIQNLVEKCLQVNSEYKIKKVDMYSNTKAKDDGYKAIHLYFRNNNRCFPIEIQIWNQKDALLNFYTHDIIYKRTNGEDFSYYGCKLRKWIDSVPSCPNGIEIDYIKYLYKMIYLEQGGSE